MNKLELNNLILLSISNNTEAYRKIVENFQSLVYSLAFRLLNNEDEAKDIVQEVFIKIWLNLKKYNFEKKFETWIYTIATNLCLDKLKSRNRITSHESIDTLLKNKIFNDNPESKLLDKELGKVIEVFTNELTPKQKIVFTLRYLEDLDTEEIAKITNMTPDKIKSNLFLARKEIQRKLKNYGK